MRRPSLNAEVTRLYFTLLLVLLIAVGCQSYTGYIVSGESLDATGRAFVQIGNAYNQQLDAKKITPDQYRAWAGFATKFKASYPPAVQLWKSAVVVNDAALTKKSSEIITALVGELAKFGAVVGIQLAGGV